jgi:hypothetical protein
MAREPATQTVQLRLCDACLAGLGEECHTPGCALYMHRSPGHPIMPELYEVLEAGPAYAPGPDRSVPIECLATAQRINDGLHLRRTAEEIVKMGRIIQEERYGFWGRSCARLQDELKAVEAAADAVVTAAVALCGDEPDPHWNEEKKTCWCNYCGAEGSASRLMDTESHKSDCDWARAKTAIDEYHRTLRK